MRWLIAITGWMLLAPVVQAQEAQKLYDALEQKLAKARAYRFGFSIEAQDRDEITKAMGTVIVAADNRLKITFMGMVGKRPTKGTIVSDGKMLVSQGEFDGKPENKSRPASAKLSSATTAMLSRAGLFVAIDAAVEAGAPKDAAELKIMGLTSIGKEKVGDRDANVIEYQLLPAGEKTPATIRLWLDAQTSLPLKRTLEARDSDKVVFRVVETYNQWEIDPKLPDETFTLPK
jgi:outer membrane lipoprotein-sorting protein